MTSFEEAAHSLQFENSQLRTELKAQQIVNMKLRKEKDDALLALHDCKEENRYTYTRQLQLSVWIPSYLLRIWYAHRLLTVRFLWGVQAVYVYTWIDVACRLLYEELKLRDQMFQEYREQKEREIAELTAIKGDLEVRLQRFGEEGEQVDGSGHFVGKNVICWCIVCILPSHFDSGGVLASPEEYRFVGASLPQLNAQEVVDALSRWDGMEDTIALFSDLLNKNGIFMFFPMMCSQTAKHVWYS